MSDIESLQTYAGQLAEAAAQAKDSAGKQHEYINGSATADVITESGPVPSLAKQAVQGQAKVTAALSEVASQMAGAMTYENIALGLAGTNNDGFFSVPSPELSEYLILYRNAAGAAIEVKRYPSSEVAVIARRGNYFLSGRATKIEQVGSSLDYRVSWGRLYIFAGAGKAPANVQAVNDLAIPNGKCAYVDLAEPLEGGEYVVHVSELPLITTANPPGTYIDDSKIILFTCLNNILGGQLQPQYQNLLDGSVSRAAMSTAIQNATARGSYAVVGNLRRFILNGSSCVLSFADLRVTRGVGVPSITIAGMDSISVPLGQALYVDLDMPLVGGKLNTQVTIGGYSTAAGGITAGSFIDDKKVYLFINELLGYSGVLASRMPVATRTGQVWLKQSANITFDTATRTLAWSAPLILPTIGGQGRITLEAGSYTFSALDNNVAYLDLDVASTTGVTPASAVKGGRYFDTSNPDRFLGLPNQAPMFYWNGASDYGPLLGFPSVSGGGTATSVLAQDDLVVKIGVETVSTFVKGAKSNSTKYLELTVAHEVRPFDPTGADAFGNADLWRLKFGYEADIAPGTTSFARTRSGIPVLTGGEIVGAWKERGAVDYIGGYHGDEVKTSFVMFLDGVEISTDTVRTLVGKKLEYVQYSKLYQCNTQNEVATHMTRVAIARDDAGAKITISQQVVWSKSLVLESSMMTMLPIKRRLSNTSGPVITDIAMRAPYAIKEDISTAGFTQVVTLGSLPDCRLWGPTGISASVEIIKHPGLQNCGFYIASPPEYNKPYYSVAGTGLSSMGGSSYTTTIGERWDVDSVIRITTTG